MKASIDEKYWKTEFPEERGLTIEHTKTARGFELYNFDDLYGQHCSLQDSSLASEAAIWLGVDNTGALNGPGGKPNEDLTARMHLTRKQVQQLLPLLHRFVEKGNLP